MGRARLAQQRWQKTDLHARLRIVRQLRSELARSAHSLLDAFSPELRAQPAERLASEIIPLAEAGRFLEESAECILSPVRIARKRSPFWLRGIEIEEQRDPLGIVFIIGPANYPLFLPGVQILQALVAGNAVLAKPGSGGLQVLTALQELFRRAGLPQDLLFVLEEDVSLVRAVIEIGVDKVVLTGSVKAGSALYRLVADELTPLILELSGSDPVFVLKGADLDRAVDAIAFGMRWNDGRTCIAPRRIFVAECEAELFGTLLEMKCPDAAASLPTTRFREEEDALKLASQSHYALGASVFGERKAARAFAKKVRAGLVVVNDMILPTADPRVAFGGRDQSGFGKTRGAEGLREMTIAKAVVVQRSKRLRHIEPLPPNAVDLFGAYASFAHAAHWRARLRAARHLLSAMWDSEWSRI
jgi:aldehyde dehydrogenase (NAD+)